MNDTTIKIEGFDRIIFNKREIKAAIRKGGGEVRKEARRLIAKRAISGAGDFPGYVTGAMSRSIKVKVGSGGGYATVAPYKTTEMKEFYPAFLNYGTSRGLEPRKNFMVAALVNKRSAIRSTISTALRKALETS
jgi:HK97 gp10 family phage protein